MLKKLLDKVRAARRRAELENLIDDASYYLEVIKDARRRLAENERRQQEIIAEERGQLPQVPANAWQPMGDALRSLRASQEYAIARIDSHTLSVTVKRGGSPAEGVGVA